MFFHYGQHYNILAKILGEGIRVKNFAEYKSDTTWQMSQLFNYYSNYLYIVFMIFFQKSLSGSCKLPENDDNAENRQMRAQINKNSVMMDHKPHVTFEEAMERFRKIHKIPNNGPVA